MPEQFVAKAGEFAGPIEVLLHLIEERKLHISQVSLATVADDFLAYLESRPENDKAETANFILVAATLMLIKSISLLPTLEVSSEEKEGIEDLERRLKLYQEIKNLSLQVKERFGREIIFSRQETEAVPVFAPSSELTSSNLVLVVKNLIANFPAPEKIPQAIVKKVLSLEEAIGQLTTRIQTALRTSFRQVVGDQKERANVIVSFLGLLELVKRGLVNVEQSAHFADIKLETGAPQTPRY